MSRERAPQLGHWEGDLIGAGNQSAFAVLVERLSRYTRLVALPFGFRADQLLRALQARLRQLPEPLRRSLTWDQGREMAAWPDLTSMQQALEPAVPHATGNWNTIF